MRTITLLMCVGAVVSCERTRPLPQRTDTSSTAATGPAPDTAYSEEWNMGEDPDEPEKSVDTRFRVRVAQFRSGMLRVWLDTSQAGQSEKDRPFAPADSIQVDGLTQMDRFTRACTYGSGPWKPHVAVAPDTIYEHDSHPKHIWLLDTASLRIRRLPPDSALCFVAGPE
jgi:hypothetical protein